MEWFEKLKLSLIAINVKGDLRHRNDHAMEHVPKGFSRWATASSYLYDMERIILELRTARSFIETLPDDAFLAAHSLTREDYAMYHQGYFLDLVHQLKDKQLQLAHAIISPDPDYSKKRENDVDLKRVLKHPFTAKIPGLAPLLNEWSEEHCGPISIALKKRTQYHHYRNPLPAAKEFLQAKSMNTLLRPDMAVHLSDYGRQMVAERGKESFEAWRKETLRKMGDTLDAATKNINAVAEALITYYRMPDMKVGEGRRIFMQFMDLEQGAKIPASIKTTADLHPTFGGLFEALREALVFAMPQEFVALYLTGSATRPEDFKGLVSDINSVIVLKNPTPELRALILDFIETPARQFLIPMDTQILSEEEFMSEAQERLRFICKTDGVLIGGTDLLRGEKERRKCYKLVWLLNRDYKEAISAARGWVNAQTDPGPNREYARAAREITRRTFRLGFGQVMGNNTVYARSYKEMKRLMDFYTPENKRANQLTYRIITRPLLVDKEGLEAMLDAYERNFYPLYDAIDKALHPADPQDIKAEVTTK